VYAKLLLREGDADRLRAFFMEECGIKAHRIIPRMHSTVYYARRPMPGVVRSSEPARLVLLTEETRFMVMAPGGENPRPELNPNKRKVGIRVHKQSSALPQILAYRERLLAHETQSVLGKRRPSTRYRNAFGARYFQLHVALLRPGSRIDRDLKELGLRFRASIEELVFDTFPIEIAQTSRRMGMD
jgi:hypothetical protein